MSDQEIEVQTASEAIEVHEPSRVCDNMNPMDLVSAEEAWYDSLVRPMADLWEAKLDTIKIPAMPSSRDITDLTSKVDEIMMKSEVELARASTVLTKIKNGIAYRKAIHKTNSKATSDVRKDEEAKVAIAKEGLIDAQAVAEAKYNYIFSVCERLRRKKEMLNMDERATNRPGSHTSAGR